MCVCVCVCVVCLCVCLVCVCVCVGSVTTSQPLSEIMVRMGKSLVSSSVPVDVTLCTWL